MAYIALGVPRLLRVGLGSRAVASCALAEHCELFAVVTSTSVQVWDAGQHRVKLGELERSAGSLEMDGVNVKGLWRPEQETLAVLTSTGRVHFYDVFEEVPQSAPVVVGGEQLRCAVSLQLRASPDSAARRPLLAEGERATELACWEGGLLLGTDRGGVQAFDWETLEPLTALLTPLSASLPPQRLMRLSLCPALRCCGAVWEGGASAVLALCGSGLAMPDKEEAEASVPPRIQLAAWMTHAGALSVALCAPRGVAAVGTGAAVLLFSLPPSLPAAAIHAAGARQLRLLRSLSLSDWGLSPSETGSAGQLAWSPCGAALAAGYAQRGAVVWSLSGCRLIHVLPRPGSGAADSAPAGQAAASPATQLLDGGTACLAWGVGGGSLLMAGAAHGGCLLELGLACSPGLRLQRARLDRAAQRGGALQVLLSPGGLLLVEREGGAEAEDAGEGGISSHAAWAAAAQQPAPRLATAFVRLPREYAANNWPLRLAAVSEDGATVAVAGSRGLALLSRRARTWRLFGDVAQERAVAATQLAWLGSVALALVSDARAALGSPPGSPPRFELLAYPRSHLDAASLLLRHPLGGAEPLAMDAVGAGGEGLVGSTLLLALPPLHLLLFRLEQAGRGARPRMALRQLRSLQPQLPPAAPFSLAACLLAPVTAASPQQILVLSAGGELGAVALDGEGKGKLRLLAREVEQLWLPLHADAEEAGSGDGEGAECTPWWLYGSVGLRLLQPSAEASPLPPAPSAWEEAVPEAAHGGEEAEPELAFDKESWPLGLFPSPGALLWLSQALGGPGSAFGGDLPAFAPQVSAQPVLPFLLRHLLLLRQDGAAADAARAAEGQPHFIHSLEWLLFTTLDAHLGRRAGEGALRRATQLIADFPEFPDVVVSVARKTDEREWRSLFGATGPPGELFQASLAAGRPRTAACYLLIIDKLEGPSAGRERALQLLASSLDGGCEYELAGELVRFLRRSGREAALDEAEAAETAHRERGVLVKLLFGRGGASTAAAEGAVVEARVAELMTAHASRLLASKELRKLFAMHRASGGAFSLPEWLEAQRGSAAARLGDFAIALNDAREALGGVGGEAELEALYMLFQRAGLADWCALVAVLLRRRSYLASAVRGDPALSRQLVAALRSPLLAPLLEHDDGYAHMLASLEVDAGLR